MEELVAPARPTLTRVRQVLERGGFRYVDLGDAIFGVGVAVAVGAEAYSVISVAAGGSESIVNLTVGVLKDLRHDRLAILNECNTLTQNNAAYPYFLHDAEAGWDVLLQVRLPIQAVTTVSDYFLGLVRQLPAYAEEGRTKINAVAGGEQYKWNADDSRRLLLRSMV